jgi:hypothetical protein
MRMYTAPRHPRPFGDAAVHIPASQEHDSAAATMIPISRYLVCLDGFSISGDANGRNMSNVRRSFRARGGSCQKFGFQGRRQRLLPCTNSEPNGKAVKRGRYELHFMALYTHLM